MYWLITTLENAKHNSKRTLVTNVIAFKSAQSLSSVGDGSSTELTGVRVLPNTRSQDIWVNFNLCEISNKPRKVVNFAIRTVFAPES